MNVFSSLPRWPLFTCARARSMALVRMRPVLPQPPEEPPLPPLVPFMCCCQRAAELDCSSLRSACCVKRQLSEPFAWLANAEGLVRARWVRDGRRWLAVPSDFSSNASVEPSCSPCLSERKVSFSCEFLLHSQHVQHPMTLQTPRQHVAMTTTRATANVFSCGPEPSVDVVEDKASDA